METVAQVVNRYQVKKTGRVLLRVNLLNVPPKGVTHLLCETRHCIGVANGLDALHLIVRTYGTGPGDEVIVPANTYIATRLAVTPAGATPVPVEPDERTCNINPQRNEAAITDKTKAFMVVHLYGQPADIRAVQKVCFA